MIIGMLIFAGTLPIPMLALFYAVYLASTAYHKAAAQRAEEATNDNRQV